MSAISRRAVVAILIVVSTAIACYDLVQLGLGL
jgi:hypothetical protein